MLVTKVKTFNISSDNQPGFFIVKVETDEGIYGLGEIGIRNWSGSIQYAIDQLSHLYLIGQNPFSTERIWQQMFRGGFFPADSVYSCAISALDIALWDIKGKSLNMPSAAHPPLGSHFLALLDGIFILAPQPHGVPAQLHGIPAQLHGGDGGPNSSKKGDKRLYMDSCHGNHKIFMNSHDS